MTENEMKLILLRKDKERSIPRILKIADRVQAARKELTEAEAEFDNFLCDCKRIVDEIHELESSENKPLDCLLNLHTGEIKYKNEKGEYTNERTN